MNEYQRKASTCSSRSTTLGEGADTFFGAAPDTGREYISRYRGPMPHRGSMPLITWLIIGCAAMLGSCASAQPPVLPGAVPVVAPLPMGNVTITVAAGERQPFLGFGASIIATTYSQYSHVTPELQFNRMPLERQQKINDLLWRDSHFNTARLWWPADKYAPDATTRNVAEGFTKPFLVLVQEAQKRGMTHLLLGPVVPKYLITQVEFTKKDGTKGTRKELLMRDVAQYAVVLAQYIKDVRDTHGITFEATGLQNEANTLNHAYFLPETMVEAVKALRRELDARGLQSVKIIAPETSNTDATAYKMVDALKADTTAWSALAGIATHSYYMGATEIMAKKIDSGDAAATSPLGTNTKEYWQTESSTPGQEEAGNVYNAAVAASTFLSDMNHRVTHWVYFVGALQEDPKDNGTRIISYDAAKTGDNWITPLAKYFYLKQLGQTFDSGAMFRASASSQEGDMTWTYGRKPRVTIAAAKNPDGSWGVGISNFTGTSMSPLSWAWPPKVQTENAPYPAQPFTVTVKVAELAGTGEKKFAVHLSGLNDQKLLEDAEQEAVTMKNGEVTLAIQPLQLVTLRSL